MGPVLIDSIFNTADWRDCRGVKRGKTNCKRSNYNGVFTLSECECKDQFSFHFTAFFRKYGTFTGLVPPSKDLFTLSESEKIKEQSRTSNKHRRQFSLSPSLCSVWMSLKSWRLSHKKSWNRPWLVYKDTDIFLKPFGPSRSRFRSV